MAEALNDKFHAAATHETDRELWLNAHHRAPAFTLAPGEMLTREQRENAWDMVRANEESEHKERMRSKAYR